MGISNCILSGRKHTVCCVARLGVLAGASTQKTNGSIILPMNLGTHQNLTSKKLQAYLTRAPKIRHRDPYAMLVCSRAQENHMSFPAKEANKQARYLGKQTNISQLGPQIPRRNNDHLTTRGPDVWPPRSGPPNRSRVPLPRSARSWLPEAS